MIELIVLLLTLGAIGGLVVYHVSVAREIRSGRDERK